MRLRQIEVFHAVYSSGSMTNAAAMLHVSQPSISKVLAHAEQQLGYLLFERSKGKLIATPEAHQLFKHVADVYRDVDRLRHVADNLKVANSGRIRIASTPAFGIELLPQAIASFRADHSDTVFEIETLHLEEINNALLESRVDIGLAFDPIANPGIEDQQLAQGRFVVLAPFDSSFETNRSITIEDLQGHPFIGLNNRGPLGRLLSTHLATSNIELDVVSWCETYHIAKALVACGVGVTIADEVTARSSVGGDVRILQLEPTLEFDIKSLHLGSTPLSIVANQFLDHLRQSITTFLA
jgi:DNA-binding transcriptional LysR family regulator